VTKETAEIVVNEAIELWLEHGGPTGLAIAEALPKQNKWLFNHIKLTPTIKKPDDITFIQSTICIIY